MIRALLATAAACAIAAAMVPARVAGAHGDGVAAQSVHAAATSVSLQASDEQQLAEKYAPIVYLRQQSGECDTKGEAYDPAPVEVVLGNPLVTLHAADAERSLLAEAPTAGDLYGKGADFFLDYRGNPGASACDYEKDYKQRAGGFTPTAYARIVTEPGHSGIALQYWFFYYFNDWNNQHEADWEMIQLTFDAGTASDALQQEPATTAYGQHGGGETAAWNSAKLRKEDGHPVVYVSKGSHASYYSPDTFIGLGEQGTGFGCDNASGLQRREQLAVQAIPDSVTDASSPFAWAVYDGQWGEKKRGEFDGPTGPNTKKAWKTPFTWEQGLRSSSVTVPSAVLPGSNAIAGFCAVVAFSGKILAVGQQWPFIVFGVSGALLATVLGLTIMIFREAREAEPAPEGIRLRRPRTMGKIVRASFSFCRQHLRLYLGIAIVFIPLGFVAAGVQRLIFAVPPGGPVIDLFEGNLVVKAMLALGYGSLQTLLAFLAVIAASAAAMSEIEAGRPISAGRAYRLAYDRLWTLVRARLRAIAIVALFALTVVGIPFAIRRAVRWFFVEQAVMLEHADARSALDVSARTVDGNWWRALGITAVFGSIALLSGPALAAILLLFTPAPLPFINAIAAVLHTALVPYTSIALTLLYFDLQERKRSVIQGAAPITRRAAALPRLGPAR